jgi:shikimate kinase
VDYFYHSFEAMNPESSQTAPNLYLIGFMGVGKSAVGRSVAKILGYTFFDVDQSIEVQAQKRIPEIFEQEGEAAFRKMERSFILSGHPHAGCVVSCGGGLVVQPGMRELLLEQGVVVCLFASEKTILERTSRNSSRPLLNVEDPAERIHRLLEERMPIYKTTGTGVCTENRPLPEVTAHVIRIYQQEVLERTTVQRYKQ